MNVLPPPHDDPHVTVAKPGIWLGARPRWTAPACSRRLPGPTGQPQRGRTVSLHEDRRHRRHRAHRLEGRRQAHRGWPRGRSRLAAARHQHDHRRRARRGARRRVGRGRRLELAELRVRRLPSISSRPRPATCWPPQRRRASGTIVALSVVGTKTLSEGGDLDEDDRRLLPGEAHPGGNDPASRRSRTRSSTPPSSSSSSRHRRRATDGGTVRLPPVRFQPMAAADVAAAVTGGRGGAPVNGIVEVGGPAAVPLRRGRPPGPRGAGRPARGRGRPRGWLLRHHRGRAHARSADGARSARSDSRTGCVESAAAHAGQAVA